MAIRVSNEFSTRLQKVEIGQDAPIVNWEKSRIVTPGDVLGYQTDMGLKLVTENPIQIFRQGSESQGLFFEGKRVVAGTVTEQIQTPTKRSHEKKSTHIQYDKTRVKQKGADFEVDPENYREHVNYDGGHIIDHKFSAENSHTFEANYFPQHFYYNQTLKEFLVKASRCDAFVEIPLYTLNPPKIGVLGQKGKYHPIPAAIIFIQIKNKKIRNIYCFPNNNIDYKKLSKRIQKSKSETLSSYFRLDPALHQLFFPAIIEATAEKKQISREGKFRALIDDVTLGMSLTECADDINLITRLCSDVLHGEKVDPKLCLTTPHFDQIKKEPLRLPFNLLGEYLVRYSLRNALKSEVISINSRLIIANVIIDFIENHHQVSDDALDFIETLSPEFHRTLKDLTAIAPHMNEEELLFFINTVLRLSSPFCHDFMMEGRDDLFDACNLDGFLRQTGNLLKLYLKRFSIADLDKEKGHLMIDILGNAQSSLEYLIETGYPEECFEDLLPILSEAAKGALELLERESKGGFRAEFQTGPNNVQMVRTSTGYLEAKLSCLVLDEERSSSE